MKDLKIAGLLIYFYTDLLWFENLDFFINWMYGAIGVADGISIRSQSWGHISFLAGILILIKALGFKINAYMLLNSQEGVVFGAGYTDVNAKIISLEFLELCQQFLWPKD